MKLLQYTIDPLEIETMKQYIKQFKQLRNIFPNFNDYKLIYNNEIKKFIVYGLTEYNNKWDYN